ncbi:MULTISPECIES: hypothetical protein [Stutzerimonas]|uniref:hypothetical protein n=1 Tax=Stutzerimonas TaxID=2901164 RepID=UPI00051F4CE5|nr:MULTISPECIES: hypothetical protein [Stutzerimonas]OKR96473.1 hypothetical protein BH602_16120 [Pseudomonas aeruginosa]OWG38804.1 hypothetical protein CAQ69_08450 [Stutzerimonas stutzeri]CDM50238.1 hypothetical protein PAWS394_1269 [Pseudomonas aeruginosa WS394]
MSINSYLIKEVLKSIKIEVEDLDDRFDYVYSDIFNVKLNFLLKIDDLPYLRSIDNFKKEIDEFKDIFEGFKSYIILCNDEYVDEWIKYGLFSADIIIAKIDYIISLCEVKL